MDCIPWESRWDWVSEIIKQWKPPLIDWKRLLSVCPFNRWEELDSLANWDSRGDVIASMLKPEDSSVTEFGAGRMYLKKYMEGRKYTPCDIADRGRGTIVFNLNENYYPDIPPGDLAIFSGVLEYVYDVPRLICYLSDKFKTIIASYATHEGDPKEFEPNPNGWVNAYSEFTFKSIFFRHGYTLEEKKSWNGSQTVFRFEKQK